VSKTIGRSEAAAIIDAMHSTQASAALRVASHIPSRHHIWPSLVFNTAILGCIQADDFHHYQVQSPVKVYRARIKQLCVDPSEMAERSLRLLCLDGGGVRGLASLYVLKRLLSYIGDPKPCDYFDLICGTSTGG
jgi:hypothetical protein